MNKSNLLILALCLSVLIIQRMYIADARERPMLGRANMRVTALIKLINKAEDSDELKTVRNSLSAIIDTVTYGGVANDR